ncbi:DUF937 domain-containing protein [Ramlibacter sp.]|uniref:DUF937 domain-containing protein n=1 Tax=Ramlibacter sp. TaxID=1917967 RepID=UPI003D12B1AE
MQITDLLAQTGGLQSIARELGMNEAQAASGAEALLPAILGGFQKRGQAAPADAGDAGDQGGLGGLLGGLLGGAGGGLLEQVLSPGRTDPEPGNDVLGEIFGSKDVSRTVAQDAAQRTGLDPSLLKKMLPLLAMLVTGLAAKGVGQARGGSGDAGGLGGMLGGILGGGGGQSRGGLGSLLDANGDGNALDDILRMAGKLGR